MAGYLQALYSLFFTLCNPGLLDALLDAIAGVSLRNFRGSAQWSFV